MCSYQYIIANSKRYSTWLACLGSLLHTIVPVFLQKSGVDSFRTALIHTALPSHFDIEGNELADWSSQAPHRARFC